MVHEIYAISCFVFFYWHYHPILIWRVYGVVAMYYMHLNLILNSNLAKSRLSITYFPVVQSLWNVVQSAAVILCAKFQTDWTTAMDVLEKRDFARFGFSEGYPNIYNSPQVSNDSIRWPFPSGSDFTISCNYSALRYLPSPKVWVPFH